MTDDLERDFEQAVARIVERVIARQATVFGVDGAYWRFRFTVRRLDAEFGPLGAETVLIDTHDGYCSFCGAETYNYDERTQRHICAWCEGERDGGNACER